MDQNADVFALRDELCPGPDEQMQIFQKSPIGMTIYDSAGQCIAANEAIAITIGATREQVLKQNYHSIKSWKRTGLLKAAVTALNEKQAIRKEITTTTTFNKFVGLDCYFVPLDDDKLLVMFNDVTEKVLMAENVKQLNGLLPICSVCKKIRDDEGYWKQLEIYISQHSEAEFSHSLCPVCLDEMYPEDHHDE